MIFYYYVHSLISHYLPCDQQSTLTRIINKTVLIFTWNFCLFTLKSMYLKYLNSLQSGKRLCLESTTIFEHMFSDQKLDNTFHVFWLHNWLLSFSSCICQLSTYLKYGNMLESDVSWFLIQLNILYPEYYLPSNN